MALPALKGAANEATFPRTLRKIAPLRQNMGATPQCVGHDNEGGVHQRFRICAEIRGEEPVGVGDK